MLFARMRLEAVSILVANGMETEGMVKGAVRNA